MIKEINNKMDYDHLLTESDPNINLVRDYLENGALYGFYLKDEPVSFIAVEIIDGEVEIKNLLTLSEHRGHGYAKALIKFIEETYNSYDTFLVGTANSSLENITFYTRLGYVDNVREFVNEVNNNENVDVQIQQWNGSNLLLDVL